MGWSFCDAYTKDRKADYVKNILSSYNETTEKGIVFKVLKNTLKGNCLWILVSSKQPEKAAEVIIVLELLAFNECWGNKSMDESINPFYYSCPIPYLKAAPVANERWRSAVLAYHAQKKVKIQLGKPYKLTSGSWVIKGVACQNVVVKSLKPLVGEVDGVMTRIPHKMFKDLTLVEEKVSA